MYRGCLLVFCLIVVTTVCQSPNNGDVRLMKNDTYRNGGRLEIYLNSQWGTVQYNTQLSQNGVAQAVCRQLGYSNYGKEGTVVTLGFPMASSDTPNLLRNVDCTYNSITQNALQHILRCSYDEITSDPSPVHTHDFAVECSSTRLDALPYDSQIHLIQGGTYYTSSGYVEIYLNDRWGPVCNMGTTAANSACRQLGYTNAKHHDTYSGLVTTDEDQLDTFARYAASSNCLRNCFLYPSPLLPATCDIGHSYINCTFSITNKSNSYGSQSECSTASLATSVAVWIIVIVAMICGLALLIALIALVVLGVRSCCGEGTLAAVWDKGEEEVSDYISLGNDWIRKLCNQNTEQC